MDMNELRLEAQDLNQQGVALLRTGHHDAAREKFEKAIELDPMLMDSYKNFGDLYMSTQEYQEAKNSYKKALLVEKNGLLHFLYGNACFMNDELHEGLENYNLAISEGYDSDEMMFFMGMAYEHMNDIDMALRYYQRACVKNPSRPDYMVKKIASLGRLGMYDEANEAVDELLLKAPEMYDGYHIKTQLLIFQNRIDEAITFAKAASARFPEDADLLYDYAKAVSLSGKFDEAIKEIESAKKMKYFEASKRKFTILEAQIYAERGDFDTAIECCNQCVAMETEGEYDGEARFMLMNLHLAGVNYEKTLEQADGLVKKDGRDMYYYAALYYKAFCTKQLGKAEEAQALYKEANSLYRLATLENPAALDIYLYRVMCLKDLEQYDKALELLDVVETLSSNIAEVHTLRADVYHAQGRQSLAEEELQKAYKLKPELKPKTESAGE